jgi:hypothetical protein
MEVHRRGNDDATRRLHEMEKQCRVREAETQRASLSAAAAEAGGYTRSLLSST